MADYQGQDIPSVSPINGQTMATLRADTAAGSDSKNRPRPRCLLQWRKVPAPRRGELIRLFGEELRTTKLNWVSW